MRRAIYAEVGQLPACAAGLDERLDRAGAEHCELDQVRHSQPRRDRCFRPQAIAPVVKSETPAADEEEEPSEPLWSLLLCATSRSVAA